ncbi:MAG: U32 family peptidase C-terminal domain-containing protein, partial [Butyrivibrio sp.]|nr:U32 family peptidase C-terminal domain-containing protein [Butyrivibrio sp.]
SCKIEGRMKTALYVATVARTYRKAIDDFFESEEKYKENMPWYLDQISKCTYRQFTTGFYFGKPTYETQIYDNNTYVNEYIYLGIVGEIDNRGYAKFEQRNKFCVGDEIEIMKPDGTDVKVTVRGMYAEDGTPVESCPHSKEIIYVDLSSPAEKYDILRMPSGE